MATASAWHNELQKKLTQEFGAKKGADLYNKYEKAFPINYNERNSPQNATHDIEHLEKLSADHVIEIDLYEETNDTGTQLHLRIYQYLNPIPLSDMLPMLEHMDVRALAEQPYEISLGKNNKHLINDFSVTYSSQTRIDIKKIKPIFQETFIQTRFGHCENDGFNKLALGAQLSWREITILRAYAKYVHQTGFRFSQVYLQNTLANHPDIAGDLVNLFKLKHDPKQKTAKNKIEELENKIQVSLDAVTSLDEDRILRRFYQLIKATVRTNYFQAKEYIAFKFSSKEVPELPLPLPLFEIFVYSPRFEGIHLRGAKVARGGIRWSDRREDFRVEVLGLMKAQRVKNAVIVPSGAKGGFVLKALPPQAPKDVVQKEVIECYKSFIRGLLDLTDNIKNEKIIRPANVVCHDDVDTYLVVAADKGTATFSDIANSISKEYDFWLGDAFASGGATGYDHKKMGITARGAWESIKRHFHELNINIAGHDFTVVGIGDMSGDVFGNGLLYSKRIKLVAAFDHRHIFLDPNPSPAISYEERARLFHLPASSWEDYNPKLISSGGGVYKRSSKSISLSAEIKKVLDIQENSLPPNELIRAILKAPVDLLYNGGIGTYVKASTESHADVGDKTNEFCRVNGTDLHCKIVGEGGNLGFTQLSRVEYALKGGLINTDFIDNSAGVDCSDHEVNAKILLNKEVARSNLTEEKRNQLLAQMTNDIAKLVLSDNYSQALVLSFSAAHSAKYIALYQAHIKDLEAVGGLDRAVEFLPDTKKLIERKASEQGLTRPELAVLLAYTKMHIKQELLKSDLPEDPYLSQIIETAFPSELKKMYGKAMSEHTLRREIIATQISNQVVNEMGITFVHRFQTETSASVAEIIRAYTIASSTFQASELQKLIESLDFKIPISLQYELLHHVRRLINLSTRWFLQNDRAKGDLEDVIKHYSTNVKKIEKLIPNLMLGTTKNYLDTLIDQFMKAGLEKELALKIASCRALYITLNVIETATQNNFDLSKTTKVYFAVGGQFNLVWFRDQIAADTREGRWDNLARVTLRDELDILQKLLTIVIMRINKKEENIDNLFREWTAKHQRAIERWNKLLEMLHGSTSIEYIMFFIALREFSSLINDHPT